MGHMGSLRSSIRSHHREMSSSVIAGQWARLGALPKAWNPDLLDIGHEDGLHEGPKMYSIMMNNV